MNLYQSLFGRKSDAKDGDVINMAEHGRVGGVSTGQPFKYVANAEFAMKVTTSGTVTYLALAKPGTAQSSASWQARKIDSSSGTVITWADGDTQFDNVATDLTALTYS